MVLQPGAPSHGCHPLNAATPLPVACLPMQADSTSRETLTLWSCARRPMVWGPLAVGGLAFCFLGWPLLETPSSYKAKVLTALFGIVAAVLATSGVAWLRICLVKRPTFVCGVVDTTCEGAVCPARLVRNVAASFAAPRCLRLIHRPGDYGF